MKKSYARFVELSNKGAKELGFADTGAMWRSKYDMPPDEFAKELDRLWEQLRPLYLSLHTYVRAKLRERYGDSVPADGPIPAHLLGNIWAQDWTNIYDIVGAGGRRAGASLTDMLRARKVSPIEMTRYGERFFTSLGFEPLPQTFWERSLFVKPRDREVVCHASAWNINNVDDLRIKMCIDQTEEDFTRHPPRAGAQLLRARLQQRSRSIFRDSANDGFHEAIGDTIALSVTPEYLVKVGLLDRGAGRVGRHRPAAAHGARAAGLPAVRPGRGLSGGGRCSAARSRRTATTRPGGNCASATRACGRRRRAARSSSIRAPSTTFPATRRMRAISSPRCCSSSSTARWRRTAGCTTPLHRCSIYGSAAAGKRLKATLEMGASRPWPDALEALTGQRQMDATRDGRLLRAAQGVARRAEQGRKVGW